MHGRPVEFTLLVSASSQVRRKMATLVQDDLARLGIRAQATPIEFGAMIDAVLNTRKFEGALWGLASGDTDPTSEMNVWSAAGSLHAWNMKAKDGPAPPLEAWEMELDGLMRSQMSETDPARRKRTYARVQQLVAEQQPMVFLVSPHILSAARNGLENFQPAILEPVVLWNCARFFWGPVGP
jgi:peptide/nickel transport system substrate-binding protein